MKRKKICPKCGKPIKSKSKRLRSSVDQIKKIPAFAFLETVLEESKDYCDSCWGNTILPVAKQGLLYDL